ncbi:putative RDD family membrane protein YckC [Marmoricola sp. OAE513]|uniref:RDD family protein n=1 Tax=Marmoricola sp. OAE513 TaxID=2817894 RepID=UPI001AE7E381
MTQIPAGWYPDPAAPDPAKAGSRYWDGNAWTEQVQAPSAPAAYPPAYPQYTAPSSFYDQGVPSTPDGQPLAGWWMRVLATILDAFFQVPLLVLAALPAVTANWDSLEKWVDDNTSGGTFSYESGDKLPAVLDITTGPGLALYASVIAASALYSLVFLFWKHATPGKLAVGLRIRRRETDDLPAATILVRFAFVFLLGLLTNLPLVGTLFVLLVLLDYLWPLWDKNKQALHDKIVGTNVVKKR